jgi:hypothetical protein
MSPMYEILSKKESGSTTKVIYKLNVDVDTNFLEKLNKLGKTSMTRFNRFDRVAKPSFKIKNRKVGLEINGKLGDHFLFCELPRGGKDAEDLVESTLKNVG